MRRRMLANRTCILRQTNALKKNVAATDASQSKTSPLVGSCSFPVGMYEEPYSTAGFMSARMNDPTIKTTLDANGATSAASAKRLRRGVPRHTRKSARLTTAPAIGIPIPSMRTFIVHRSLLSMGRLAGKLVSGAPALRGCCVLRRGQGLPPLSPHPFLR